MSENEKQSANNSEPTDGTTCDVCGHAVVDSAMIVGRPEEDSLCVNCRAQADPENAE